MNNHLHGAIVLGALGGISRDGTGSVPDTRHAEAAAGRALASARRLARSNQRSAKRIADVANRVLAKARAAHAVHKVQTRPPAPPTPLLHPGGIGLPVAPSTSAYHAQPTQVAPSAFHAQTPPPVTPASAPPRVPRVTRVRGDGDWNFPSSDGVQILTHPSVYWDQMAGALDAVAQAGTIESAVKDLMAKLPDGDLKSQGQKLVDRCDAVINGASADSPDPSVVQTVAGIKTDADVWTQAATAALAGGANPPAGGGDSGGAGGGDAGGGGDSGGGGAPADESNVDWGDGQGGGQQDAPSAGAPDMLPFGGVPASLQDAKVRLPQGSESSTMTSAGAPMSTHASFLQRRLGPLPAWGWGAIGVGAAAAIGGIIYWRRK